MEKVKVREKKWRASNCKDVDLIDDSCKGLRNLKQKLAYAKGECKIRNDSYCCFVHIVGGRIIDLHEDNIVKGEWYHGEGRYYRMMDPLLGVAITELSKGTHKGVLAIAQKVLNKNKIDAKERKYLHEYSKHNSFVQLFYELDYLRNNKFQKSSNLEKICKNNYLASMLFSILLTEEGLEEHRGNKYLRHLCVDLLIREACVSERENDCEALFVINY
ncbi:hypothetical protein KJ632_05265, partial [Patescibacteria group bacterium]|nr:hypothetical protein [Patescibacteria group bacterium]